MAAVNMHCQVFGVDQGKAFITVDISHGVSKT
jgi:hypothetical protein